MADQRVHTDPVTATTFAVDLEAKRRDDALEDAVRAGEATRPGIPVRLRAAFVRVLRALTRRPAPPHERP